MEYREEVQIEIVHVDEDVNTEELPYEILRLSKEVIVEEVLWLAEFAFLSDGTCFKRTFLNFQSDDETSSGWQYVPKIWKSIEELYNLATNQKEKGWFVFWHPDYDPAKQKK